MVPETETVTQEPEVTVTPDVIQEEQEPEMLTGVVVDCVKLNVRSAAEATAPVICTIRRGTEVVIIEDESTDEFYAIYTASGIEGFCMKQYISIES